MSKSDSQRGSRRTRRYTHGPHVYERNGRFYLHIPPAQPGDAPTRRSLNTSDRVEAERQLGEHLAGRRDQGALQGAPKESPLKDIVREYLSAPHGWSESTKRSCIDRAAAWLNWCHGKDVTLPSQITGDLARQWVSDRLAADREHSTINRDLSVIKGLLEWAAHQDRALCTETPFTRIPRLREDRREQAPIIPSPREIRAVVRAIVARGHARAPVLRGKSQPERARKRIDRNYDPKPEARVAALYVALSLATGARISEIAGLTLAQLHQGGWTVPPSKGHAERNIPLDEDSERAARELVGLLAVAKSRNGKLVTLNERWALDLLTWGCHTAGLPRFEPHDLRRTFATECRRHGLPITLIRDLMGHKDTATTERYLGRYREDAATKVPMPEALRDLMGAQREDDPE